MPADSFRIESENLNDGMVVETVEGATGAWRMAPVRGVHPAPAPVPDMVFL